MPRPRSSSSTIRLSFAPSSPCRCRPAMSVCSGDRRFTRDAVSCRSGGRTRTLIARSRISRPTVRRPLINLFVSPERFELSTLRLKVGCSTAELRAQEMRRKEVELNNWDVFDGSSTESRMKRPGYLVPPPKEVELNNWDVFDGSSTESRMKRPGYLIPPPKSRV